MIVLAELVVELTGSKSKLVFKELPEDDPIRRRPDITLASEKLSWQPTVPLREGLAQTIEWFRTIDPSHFRHDRADMRPDVDEGFVGSTQTR